MKIELDIKEEHLRFLFACVTLGEAIMAKATKEEYLVSVAVVKAYGLKVKDVDDFEKEIAPLSRCMTGRSPYEEKIADAKNN